MAESSEILSFVKRHFEDVKDHWKSNLSFLDYYKKTLGWKKPLPKWTDADVEEFIASDPIYGPQLKAIRESRKFAMVGAVLEQLIWVESHLNIPRVRMPVATLAANIA